MAILVLVMAVWLVSGYLIARYGAEITDLLLLIPVSLGSGLLLHFALLNIFLRILPVPTASWLVLVIQLFIGGGCWWYKRGQVGALTLSLPRNQAIFLAVIWLSVVGILFIVRQRYAVLDEVDHAPRAILMGLYGLPATITGQSHANPAYCGYYHYAENAAEGVLWRQTGIRELEKIADLRVAYGLAAVLGLCFNFLRRLKFSVTWALAGTFLFLTLSPANWLAYGTHSTFINDLLPEGHGATYARQVGHNFDFAVDEYAPFVHPPDLLVPLTSYMDTPNPVMFWIPAFLAWLAWLTLSSPSTWGGGVDSPSHVEGKGLGERIQWGYVLIGGLVGISALYFETAMPLIAITIGLSLLWQVITPDGGGGANFSSLAKGLGDGVTARKTAFINLLLYTLSALLLMIFQGGTITDTLFCEPLGNIHAQVRGIEGGSLASFNFNGTLEYAGGYSEVDFAPVRLLNPADWVLVLLDWGLALFLYPLWFGLAVYQRQWVSALILGVGGGLILFSFAFTNQVTADNNYRFAVLPLWIGAALSVGFLQPKGQGGKISRYWRAGLFGLLLPIFSLTSVVNVGWYLFKPATPSLILHPIDYEVQAEWLGKLDTLTESVFDPSLDLQQTKGTARPILIFGTHGRHILHVSLPEIRDPRTQVWRDNVLPADLTALGYTHLYIDQDFWAGLAWFQRENLANPDYYLPLGEWSDPQTGEWRRLYKIVGTARYIEGETVGAGTLGLSPANFTAYQAHNLSLELGADAVIFSPKTGVQVDRLTDILAVSNAIEAGGANREPLFDLLTLLTQMQFEYELAATPAQLQAIQDWRVTKSAASLTASGANYLLVDGVWLSWLNEAEHQTLQTEYELVTQWDIEGAFYRLYQVGQ